MKNRAFLIACIILSLAACSPGQLLGPTVTPSPVPCSVQSADFIKQSQSIMTEWDDAVKIAQNTSRIALAPQIVALQAIKRKGEAFTAPDCAAVVKNRMTVYHEAMIDAFISFMAQDADYIVNKNFDKAQSYQTQYIETLVKLETSGDSNFVP